MSYGGHVLDMINRTKQNAYLKKYRRERYKKIKELYCDEVKKKNLKFKDPDISPEELEKIKENIRNKIKRDRKIKIVKVSITTIIAAIVIAFLLNKVFNDFN